VAKLRRYPRGSEWRKWDLHLHAPGTKLSDEYGSGGTELLDRYCTALEESDVALFGITDYFSLASFFAVKERYGNLFPNSEKVLFPNVELRLNESVNRDQQEVHIHLILRPDIDEPLGDKLLGRLVTELKESHEGPRRSCKELVSTADFASATVSRQSIETAVEETFGKGHAQRENVLIVVAAGDSGNRPETGVRRKENLAEEIDRLSHATFGNASNVEFFLDPTRGRDDRTAVAKPVFSGCDAHSFGQLEALGKEVGAPDQRSVTWIKADPTFEGLLQTLVEPDSRVRLGAARPDRKEPYKVIDSIHFSGREDFPDHLMLNPNLVSVIGSRSSGKSALLAYIAHSVDKDYTEAQQLAADPSAKENSIGPAPGMTWGQVEDISCEINWAGGDGPGKVIYIPQNSLFWISEAPNEITAKILPTLYRLDPDFETAHRQMGAQMDAAGTEIRNAAGEWFRLAGEREASKSALRDLGDREAISETRITLESEIEKLREASSLSETETREYEELGQRLTAIDIRQREIEAAGQLLAPHLIRTTDGYEAASSVDATLRLVPAPVELPAAIRSEIEALIETTQEEARTKLANAMSEYQVKLDEELDGLRRERDTLRADNKALVDKNEANAEIEALVVEKKKQDEALERIEGSAAEIEQLGKSLDASVTRIEASILDRQAAVDQLKSTFDGKQRELRGDVGFSMEQQLSRTAQEALSHRLNRQQTSDFVDRDTGVDLDFCQEHVGEFLAAMHSGAQKVIKGQDREQVAIDVLLAGPEVRFTAEIEGDQIGGFDPSTMTPGKQALFALTLILNESEEAWPLLIDQPEDDLDSRSIYEVLVQYLCERKKERQIIMVSHDANLVIGADSEQVVVTNRHGDDRQNKDGRIFGYFSGSLEHSAECKDSPIAFELGGIREHSCEILDGGEEAFRKRQEKYKFR
jgi:hypothetical protein